VPTRRLTACFLVGLWLLAAITASSASGNTVALYEEGKPVPDGAKLDVEITGPCYRSEPEVLSFPARMTANGAAPVVVSAESARNKGFCVNPSTGGGWTVELYEIQLNAVHKAETVLARFLWHRPDPEHPHCIYEFHKAKGNFRLPSEAVVETTLVGGELEKHTCGSRRVRLQGLVIVTVRGGNGKVLEVR
jgi:hypothetical protein